LFFLQVDSADVVGDENPEPLVTFPDGGDTPPPVTGAVSLSSPNLVNSISPNGLSMASASSSSETVKFEQKRMTSNVQTKVIIIFFTHYRPILQSSVSISGRGLQSKTLVRRGDT